MVEHIRLHIGDWSAQRGKTSVLQRGRDGRKHRGHGRFRWAILVDDLEIWAKDALCMIDHF